ncbi:MAG TPA: DUF4388 domain-containing protein [Pyrinomonadaceae bacterium]|nr:DUF4388 domain-containing protein [Pyrinomonadaceae bacterium]
MSVLDLIKQITANHESGRLEINAAGTPGTLLFYEGKLVDARLGSLSGFQAVNAAVSLQDAEVSFDHVEPASHVSTITPSERIILSRFFGIEAADVEQPAETLEPEKVWNPAPEPVVPLSEARRSPLAFFSRPGFVVVCVALLLGVVVGAVLLRSQVRTLQQSAAVASAVGSVPSLESQAEVKPVADEQGVKQVADGSALMNGSEQTVSVPQQQANVYEQPESSQALSPGVNDARQEPPESNANLAERDVNVPTRDANVHDLSGKWRVVNTVENTAYKSFDNMEVGFRLTINQNGKEFTAKGEKFSENGQALPVGRRTFIQVKGSIDGDTVVATFVEDGRARRTNGRFVWKLQSDGNGLAGTFVSTAANSRGRSALQKEH